MKTELLRNIQRSIDMRSDRITELEQASKLGRTDDWKERIRLGAEQHLAKKIMKRMLELENIVTYMENHPNEMS